MPKELSDLPRSNAIIDESRRKRFQLFLFILWGILIFYCVFYYVLNAPLALYTVLTGALIIQPVALYLSIRRLETAASLLMAVSCVTYIYLTSLGFQHKIDAENYFVPAAMLPMILFAHRRVYYISFSIILVAIAWVVTTFGGSDFVPTVLIAHDAPIEAMQKINYVGSFFISLVIVFIFLRNTLELKDVLVGEVREREQRLNRITQAMSEGLVLRDATGRIYSHNPAAANILGMSSEEITGNSYTEGKILGEDGKPLDSTGFTSKRTLESGSAVRDVIMGLRGGEKWVKASSVPFLENGERHVATIFSDITELKNREKNLQEAQRIAKLGNFKMDLQAKTLEWSSELYSIFEIPEPQSPEKLWDMFLDKLHPSDYMPVYRTLERARIYAEGFALNYRIMLNEGKQIKYLHAQGRVTKGDKEQTHFLVGICQDVSGITNLQNQNSFILDSLGIGIWHFDPKRKQFSADRSLGSIFEVDLAQLEFGEASWEPLIAPEYRSSVREQFSAALRGEGDFQTNFEILLPDGGRKHVGAVGKVERNTDGRPIQVYGLCMDRTREVLMEQSLQLERSKVMHNAKLASLGEMAAGVAHEINNPLGIITGSLELLNKYRGEPEKFAQKLEVLTKACHRIEKIVKGLKKFTRQNEGAPFKEENLDQIISEAMIFSEPRAKSKFVPVKVSVGKNLRIYCDAVEIEQVVINLVNNAVDAVADMEEKWIEVKAFENGAGIILQIVDSGPGISLELEQKMFQPFYTTKPVGQGTGLGLSIVHGILELHKASIRINRTEYKNTCFEIQFPRSVSQTGRVA